MIAFRARLAEQPEGYRITIGRVLAIYSGLMLVCFLSSTDQTIVATALPSIVADIGGLAQYSWVFTAYVLAATISIPLYGKLSDVYGKRRLLVASVAIFLGGSVLCGLARSMPMLIAFRVVQGLGGGGLVPLAMATVASIVPLRDRGRYQGMILAAFAGGAATGPLVGGFVVDHATWPWIFYVNVPVGVLAVAVVVTRMGNPTRTTRRPVDWAGAATLAAASMALMLGLIWGGRQYAWSSLPVVATLSGAVALSVAFALVERRAADPILLFGALRQREVAASVACYALGGMVTLGAITWVPLFVQGVGGRTATESGLVLWPHFLGGACASFLLGQWLSRGGRLRPTALLGPVVMWVAMLLLWRMGPHTTPLAVARNTLLLGVGWGMMAQVFILSVQNAVARSVVGSATALMVFSRSMGAALGVAAMGAIVNHGLPPAAHLHATDLGGSGGSPAARETLAHAIGPAFLAASFFALAVLPLAAWGIREIDLKRSVDEEPVVLGGSA